MYEIYWVKNRNLRKRCRNLRLKDGLMIGALASGKRYLYKN
jgi:hypothetical protein